MLKLDIGFLWTIVNLLVLYLLMKKFLFRPVVKIMEQREKLIQDQLDSAKNTQQEAMQLKTQYEKSIEDAQGEAAFILNEAKNRAQEQSDSILKEADAEARRVLKEAEKEIERERQKAMRNISDEVAGLAVSIAEKAVGRQGAGAFDGQMLRLLLEEGAQDE